MIDVALLDTDPDRASALTAELRAQGLKAESTADVADVEGLQPQCILGVESLMIDQLEELKRLGPCVVIGTSPSIPGAVRCMRRGACDYLEWPITTAELIAAVERARADLRYAHPANLQAFPLIGSSPAMQLIKDNISKAGPTDSPVLVVGSSGSGKELVARALHASSTRASAPLMSINCATVPNNLIESELFGVARDDGRGSAAGLVEAADGGTLFLDEIAELPDPAQAKLLQVLEGATRRVGSSTSERVDVRLLAATHRDLEQLVEAGQFRQDLYYRLKVIVLELPPLNARQDDVVEIAEWLLSRTAERLGKSGLSLGQDAIQAMRSYHWPGNVRELENAIERAVILADADSEISQALLAIEPSANQAAEMTAGAAGELTSLEDYFVKFVQQHQDQLTETELAEKLGISRKSLWERRQRLNIPRRKTKKRGRRQDSASN